MKTIFFSLLIFVLLQTTFVTAQNGIPTTMSYQGLLTLPNGVPVSNGMYPVDFTLWDDATSNSPSNCVWGSPTVPLPIPVDVKNGAFSVTLGLPPQSPITAPFTKQYWLQVKMVTINYSTRIRLTTTPYSFRSVALLGPGSTATGEKANVGGMSNEGSGDYSNIGGGRGNIISMSGDSSVIAGGTYNTIQSPSASIGGGSGHRIESENSTISGGNGNSIQGEYSMGSIISGGSNNTIENTIESPDPVGSSTISGGNGHTISESGNASIGGGSHNKIYSPSGTISGGEYNHIDYSSLYGVIGGGEQNKVYSRNGTISGGNENMIEPNAEGAVISGGVYNNIIMNATSSTIGGGTGNMVEDGSVASTIAGGSDNRTGALGSTVGGGISNNSKSQYATIAGGFANYIIPTSTYGTIGGGQLDSASGIHATVGGGFKNHAKGRGSFVGGGGGLAGDAGNKALADFSSVVGGTNQRAEGEFSFIGGGVGNSANNFQSIVVGGEGNVASGSRSFIGSGSGNQANADYTTISGGESNVADGDHSYIGGGESNFTTSPATTATISGGAANRCENIFATVGGGNDNQSSGIAATISGGESNVASGDYSFASGRRAKALHHGSFVWADHTDADFSSTGVDQFLIRATGGVGIGTNSPLAPLHVNKSISTSGDKTQQIDFSNSVSNISAYGLKVIGTPLGLKGTQIGVDVNSSVTTSDQGGSVLSRLSYASSFTAQGIYIGTYGTSSPSKLQNGIGSNVSQGLGGYFQCNPSATLTLNSTGTYWVGGVYGEVSGTVDNTPSTGAVAGVIGIDNSTGTSTSYAGYFQGDVKVTGKIKLGTATIYSGTGSPLNVVTGNVGDLFLRTDGGTGSTMYVKETGAGTTTGWIAK